MNYQFLKRKWISLKKQKRYFEADKVRQEMKTLSKKQKCLL